MKRRLCCVLLLMVFAVLAGCNGTKEVPEYEIQHVVESYFYDIPTGAISTDYEVTHNWDNETKTDTVQIKAFANYEYGMLIAQRECIWQYERSNDIWHFKRGTEWRENAEYNEMLENLEFSGQIYPNKGDYVFELSDADFDTGEVTIKYWVLASIPDSSGWGIQYHNVCVEGTVTSKIEDWGTRTVETNQGNEREIPLSKMVIIHDDIGVVIGFTVRGIERVYIDFLTD